MSKRSHEISINSNLAQALCRLRAKEWKLGETVFPETLGIDPQRTGEHPDIMISVAGRNPICIECEIEPEKEVFEDARKRLGMDAEGERIESVIAIELPKRIRDTRYQDPEKALNFLLGEAQVKYAWVYGKDYATARCYPEEGMIAGDIRDFADFALHAAIPAEKPRLIADRVALILRSCAKTIDNCVSEDVLKGVHLALGRRQSEESPFKTVTVLWLNAMLVQNRIAEAESREDPSARRIGVKSIGKIKKENGQGTLTKSSLRDAWEAILNVDYSAIFKTAQETLEQDLPSKEIQEVIQKIQVCVQMIEEARLESFVDIAGELFPRMASDRKESAAFYTLPESAELLARLTIPTSNGLAASPPEGKEWSSFDIGQQVNLGDFACGTGTLLRAGYRRIRALVESAGGDTSKMHKGLMEQGICGTDVSGIAVNLTASGLAAMDVTKDFDRPNISMLEVGGPERLTGSIEFAKEDLIFPPQPGLGRTGGALGVIGMEEKDLLQAKANDSAFHFILMNPPYASSRGGPVGRDGESVHRLFAHEGVQEEERGEILERARQLTRGTCANFQGGIATAFCAIGYKKLREKGRIGLVLPASAAAEPSWKKVRTLFESEFRNVIAVMQSGRSQLSADTGLNEILLVGQKGKKGRKGIRSVTLMKGPSHMPGAAETGRAILRDTNQEGEADHGPIRIGSEIIGFWVDEAGQEPGDPWGSLGAEDPELAIAAQILSTKGTIPQEILEIHGFEFSLPPLPMKRMDKLFHVGPTHDLIGHLRDKDPRGAFVFDNISDTVKHVRGPRTNRSLWGTNSRVQKAILVEPTHHGTRYGKQADVEKMKSKRSTLFYQRNMRWTSQALLAARTRTPVMGGRAWTALQVRSPLIGGGGYPARRK